MASEGSLGGMQGRAHRTESLGSWMIFYLEARVPQNDRLSHGKKGETCYSEVSMNDGQTEEKVAENVSSRTAGRMV